MPLGTRQRRQGLVQIVVPLGPERTAPHPTAPHPPGARRVPRGGGPPKARVTFDDSDTGTADGGRLSQVVASFVDNPNRFLGSCRHTSDRKNIDLQSHQSPGWRVRLRSFSMNMVHLGSGQEADVYHDGKGTVY